VELARSGRSFVKGLLTNLANPKAIIYFGSVFSLFVGDSVGAGSRREKALFTWRASLCERDSMIQAWRAEASSAPTSINSEP
ncbi:LysE family transporter, partial [Klebsiella pneumoniae]|uniref:LysE family transporter n=1 Tax=Klebsiella pneumoniae TaxID=573 RepID=UPI0023814B76